MGRMDDYVEVPERIELFYKTYPDGRLVTADWHTTESGGNSYVVVTAKAYRTHDDPHPGVGLAWEIVPGKTNFTRDSELMNAETSAWGRAIVALGPPFVTKRSKIASREEVENRQEEKPKSFVDQVRATGKKAAEIRKWAADQGFTLDDVGTDAKGLTKFLEGLDSETQESLLAWAL